MKALTLHAPWAWAICYAGKRVENRTWEPPITMIGQDIAIHAGSISHWNPREVMEMMEIAKATSGIDLDIRRRVFRDATTTMLEGQRFCSAVVAVAKLARVDPPVPGKVGMDGWRVLDQHGWCMEDVRVIDPVPCKKGMLGLWTLPSDVEAAVKERVPDGRVLGVG